MTPVFNLQLAFLELSGILMRMYYSQVPNKREILIDSGVGKDSDI